MNTLKKLIQPVKIQLEYRVIAVNKAGEGQAANTEMVERWPTLSVELRQTIVKMVR